MPGISGTEVHTNVMTRKSETEILTIGVPGTTGSRTIPSSRLTSIPTMFHEINVVRTPSVSDVSATGTGQTDDRYNVVEENTCNTCKI